ncbi:nucleotidyltransferase family protein [Hydrobacter penzbergensis]|uniref:nucleotidyltransferase family protein n=1 Tax=Hydrobacter penzbergensis TaxID=1235997 RepID=UPI001113CB4C
MRYHKGPYALFQGITGVRSIGLFGSYANGYMKETSDVDLLIDMPADFSNEPMCCKEFVGARI